MVLDNLRSVWGQDNCNHHGWSAHVKIIMWRLLALYRRPRASITIKNTLLIISSMPAGTMYKIKLTNLYVPGHILVPAYNHLSYNLWTVSRTEKAVCHNTEHLESMATMNIKAWQCCPSCGITDCKVRGGKADAMMDLRHIYIFLIAGPLWEESIEHKWNFILSSSN